ncbi:hypothetical protein CON95_27085 [Bacillus toyonensis]|uniref:hypothetical protein n=1 Tax=Bacillus toyonensis TaxID=155322 RepID=UPI000BEBA42D|nr:hypothetical protein [Bacillus toyonensis]PEE20762.1 hypothetical protein CON95_27085 [Bacillus toyonensis]
MRNTLGDLNNHLFEQLERLNDDELKGKKLSEEINRANAVAKIASKIIENGSLVLKAQIASKQRLDIDVETPKILEAK